MAERIESIRLGSRRLTLDFAFGPDRFGHTVGVADGDSLQVILSSLEGQPENDWPSSPVLQHLHVERRSSPGIIARRESQRIGLLVGMAGRNHWSLSAEPEAGSASFVFDVACRVSDDRAQPLGSSYTVHATNPIDGEHGCIVPIGNGLQLRIGGFLEPHTRVAIEESGRLRVLPAIATATTSRWKYRIELESDQTCSSTISQSGKDSRNNRP